MIVCYVTVWAAYAVSIQWGHFLARSYDVNDTGLVADLIFRTTVYGEFLSSPLVGGSHMYRHVNPTILLLAPCLWISPSGWGLVWGNVLVVAIGAVACAQLAWRITRHPVLVHVVVIWYLTHRMMIVNLLMPHFELLFCPLILWMIHASLRRRWVLYGILLILTLGVRADIGLPTAVFGVCLLFGRSYVPGIITVVVSLGVPAVIAMWIMPALGHQEASANLWSTYGDNWPEIFQYWMTHPLDTARQLATSKLTTLFASTGGVLLLSPAASLTTIVSMFLHVLGKGARPSLAWYQTAAAIPWMVWGVSCGLRRILNWWRAARPGVTRSSYRRGVTALVVVAAVLPVATTSGMLWRREARPHYRRFVPRPVIPERNRRILRYLREELPPNASVAAQRDLYTFVPYRRGLVPLRDADGAEFVLFDRYGLFKLPSQEVEKLHEDLRKPSEWRVVHEDDGFFVFHRLHPDQVAAPEGK